MSKKIIIGTRGSELALWQARYAQQLLLNEGFESELKIIVTSGDKNQKWENNFDKLEGKNFFTKELEDALLKKEIDLAVHSFKDVESSSVISSNHSLIIAGLSKRHPANDILILHKDSVDTSQIIPIKQNATIGTSSARRYAQLKSLRPDVNIQPLRGNVPTRIEKLKKHLYDGIILARAGVERLGIDLSDFFVLNLPMHFFVPAAGQGIIAFQTHNDNVEIIRILKKISDKESENFSFVERSIAQWIGGGCSQPLGLLCEKNANQYRLYISFNTDKNLMSIHSILESVNLESLVNKAKENIQHIQEILRENILRKVFISKKLDESSYLKRLIKRLNWEITDIPMIELKGIPFNSIPECDWIFFTSKNAVKYFFESNVLNIEDLQNKKFACIGDSTKRYLEQYGVKSHFTGDSNSITLIAENFSKQCAGQKVLFPCSSISNKSIGDLIKEVAEVMYLPVYENVESSKKLDTTFDYYIFTSPSNVRSFLKSNSIPNTAYIIALGESTQQELLKHKIDKARIILPVAFDEVAISAAMMSVV
jgi:hydroxymethylbilane synthase